MTAKTAERRRELKVALIDAAERAISARGLEALRARASAKDVPSAAASAMPAATTATMSEAVTALR